MAILYATHGYTGSGKSTFARKFCSENNITRLSHDEMMIDLYGNNPRQEHFQEYAQHIDALLEKKATELLNQNKDVFLDIGLFKKSERDFWKKIAKKYNATFTIFYVKCSSEVAFARTLERTSHNPKDSFLIDENAFNIINARLEPLHPDEEHIVVSTANQS